MKEIFERVSIRKYTDQPVEEEKILAILRAAMAAPSAGNQQPWEFFVVQERGMLEALAAVSPYSGCTKAAPLAIVSAYREKLWAPAYAQIDMSIGMENLWLGIAPIEQRMKAVEEIVGIPEGLRAFAVFPLGYPAEKRAQQDRFDEGRIHFL